MLKRVIAFIYKFFHKKKEQKDCGYDIQDNIKVVSCKVEKIEFKK